jgi:hypothetical protein
MKNDIRTVRPELVEGRFTEPRHFDRSTGSRLQRERNPTVFFSMIRTKAKLAPFMLSLSKHKGDESFISPFDKLRANGNICLYAYHCFFAFLRMIDRIVEKIHNKGCWPGAGCAGLDEMKPSRFCSAVHGGKFQA